MKNLSTLCLLFVFTTEALAQNMTMGGPPGKKPPMGVEKKSVKEPAGEKTSPPNNDGGGSSGSGKLNSINVARYKKGTECGFGKDIGEDDKKVLDDSLSALKGLKGACEEAKDEEANLAAAIQNFKTVQGNAPQNSETNIQVTCSNYKQLYNQDYKFFTSTYRPKEPAADEGMGGMGGMGAPDASVSPFDECNSKTEGTMPPRKVANTVEEAMKCASDKLSDMYSAKQNECIKFKGARKIEQENELITEALTKVTDAIKASLNKCKDVTLTDSEDKKKRRGNFLGSVLKFVGKAASLATGPLGALAVAGITDIVAETVKNSANKKSTVKSIMDEMEEDEDFEKLACLYEQVEKRNFRCSRKLADRQLSLNKKMSENECIQDSDRLIKGFDQFYDDVDKVVEEVRNEVERTKPDTDKKGITYNEKYADHQSNVSGIIKNLSQQLKQKGPFGVGKKEMPFGVFLESVVDQNMRDLEDKRLQAQADLSAICSTYAGSTQCKDVAINDADVKAPLNPKTKPSTQQKTQDVKPTTGKKEIPRPTSVPDEVKVQISALKGKIGKPAMDGDPEQKGELALLADRFMILKKTVGPLTDNTYSSEEVFTSLMKIKAADKDDSFHKMVMEALDYQKEPNNNLTYRDSIQNFENEVRKNVTAKQHLLTISDTSRVANSKFWDNGSFKDMQVALKVPTFNLLQKQMESKLELLRNSANAGSLSNKEDRTTANEQTIRPLIRMCAKLKSSFMMTNDQTQSESFDLSSEDASKNPDFVCNMFNCPSGLSTFSQWLKDNKNSAGNQNQSPIYQNPCSSGDCPSTFKQYICAENDRLVQSENDLMNEFENKGKICGRDPSSFGSLKGLPGTKRKRN